MLAQVADMRLDETTFAEVVAALASNERPVSLDKARLERQIKVLANQNVEGTLDDEAYVARKRELKRQIEALERSARPGIPGRPRGGMAEGPIGDVECGGRGC